MCAQRRLVNCLFLVSLITGMAVTGEANADDAANVRETFRAAVALEAAGDWANALVKLREVSATKPTPQVRFHIARCQEKLGKWTEAIGTYRLAIGEAEAVKANDVAKEADAARVALEALLPTLTLVRAPGAEGVMVSLDGVDLGESAIGVPLGVDPGPHTVEIYLVREKKRTEVISLAAKEKKTLALQIPDNTAQAAQKTGNGQATATAEGVEKGEDRPSKTPAWVMFGVGAGMVTTSVIFWVLRGNTISDLDNRCVNGRCPPSMESTADKGKLYTGVSIGTAVAGVAALGAGGYFLWRASHKGNQTGNQVGLGMRVQSGGADLVLGGQF